MTFAQSTIAAPAASLPDPVILKIKAASGEPIIYQPYMGPAQRHQVQAGATPFDISFNTSPDTREYELFQTLHAHHRAAGLKPEAFWGLVSSKFELKAVSTFPEFVAQAKTASQNGFDCYAYNPMIGNAAIYSSVWEQGVSGHSGMDQVYELLAQSGYGVAVPQGTKTFFFCNYVCGNERFWSSYFAFCEQVLAYLENQRQMGTPAGMAYGGNGGYWRDGSAGMRPFIVERLLGTFLQTAEGTGLRIAVYSPTLADFEWKFGHRLGGILHHLYAQKNAAIENNDPAGYGAWHQARLQFAQQPQFVMNSDDPPASWLAR